MKRKQNFLRVVKNDGSVLLFKIADVVDMLGVELQDVDEVGIAVEHGETCLFGAICPNSQDCNGVYIGAQQPEDFMFLADAEPSGNSKNEFVSRLYFGCSRTEDEGEPVAVTKTPVNGEKCASRKTVFVDDFVADVSPMSKF